MLRSVGYSPGGSVSQRPRNCVSVQSCHVPLRITTDDARSLKPRLAKLEIDWSATNEAPRKLSCSYSTRLAESAGNGANRPKMTMLRRSQRKFVGECRIGMKARLRRVVLHSRECSRCRGVRCGSPQGLVYDEGQQGCRGCRTAASG